MKCIITSYCPTDTLTECKRWSTYGVSMYKIKEDHEFENGSIIDDLYLICEPDAFEADTIEMPEESFKKGWIVRVFALPFISTFYTDIKHNKDYLKIISEKFIDGEHVYQYENMNYDPRIEWKDFIALQSKMTHKLFEG